MNQWSMNQGASKLNISNDPSILSSEAESNGG